MPAPGEDEAMLAPPPLPEYKMMADATANSMAPAPTPAAASLIARNRSGVILPQTGTAADRYILLGLLLVMFSLMSAGGMALWRRSWKDMVRAEVRRRGL